MYLQTSRLQYNLQGVVFLQTAFSKNKFGEIPVFTVYHRNETDTRGIGEYGYRFFQKSIVCDGGIW